MQYLSLLHDYIHRLDHPFYSLLAAGYLSVGAVPGFLVAHTTLPHTGSSSGWRFQFTKRHHYAAGQSTAAALIIQSLSIQYLLGIFFNP